MMPPGQPTNDIFNQIDTNNDGLITRSEFNDMVTAVQRPANGLPSSGTTANEIFDRIDSNNDGVITRSEFNSQVAVQRQVPVVTARVPPRAEAKNYDVKGEIQSAVRSCMETERNLWQKSPQLDQIISEKVDAWFRQFKCEVLEKSESVAAHFEGAVNGLREEFDTLRGDFDGNVEKVQQGVEEVHTLRHLVESRMSEVSQIHRDTDEVSRELHSQISLRLGKNHEDLCRLLELEQQQRSHDIKELSATLGARVTEYLNQESHERASQLEDISRRVEAESVERLAKLGEHQGWQTEVEGANQELVTHVLELQEAHRAMETAFSQFFSEQSEKHDAVTNRHDQLDSTMGAHHEKWQSESEKMSEDFNMRINEVRALQQRSENSAAVERERNNNRHKEFGEDLDAKHKRIMELFEEERAAWEAKFHELQPKVDTALFRLSALDAEYRGVLDSVQSKMQETASNLETSFLTSQQQCINQTEAAHQQLTKSLKNETSQRSINIQQLQSALHEEILQVNAKCDVFKEESMKEFGSIQKSLESVHGELVQTISERHGTTSQEARDLVAATRSELEKSLEEQDGRVQQVLCRLEEFQQSNIQATEDVRAEHLRSIETERDARAQQVKDLEEIFGNELSKSKIQMGDRTEIAKLFESERQSRNDHVTSEAENRARALDELSNSLMQKMDQSIQNEKAERDKHCKDLLERIDLAALQHREKLGEHSDQHRELLDSHQQLMDFTKKLESSHAKLSSRVEDVHELHNDNMAQHADKHETALSEHNNTLQAKYDAMLEDMRGVMQNADSKNSSDHSAHEERHADLKSDIETRLKELSSVVRENRSLWEARFSVLEPRVDTNVFRLDSFQADLSNGIAAVREQLGDMEASLTQSFQANLQQMISDVEAVHRELSDSIQQENRQWSVAIKEVAASFPEEISNNATTCQKMVADLKREVLMALKEMDRSVLARHTEAVSSLNQKMNELSECSKAETEAGFRNSDKKLDDFRNSSLAERASILKTLEEERATVRKAHEEHTRCLNMEHEARVRENGEIRGDLSKGLSEARRVHQESHDQFQCMMELENQRRQEFFETERLSRTADVQQLHEKIATSINDLEKREVEGRNEQIKGVVSDWNAEKNIIHQKLNEQQIAHNGLLESHQQLVGSHNGLIGSHQELATLHEQSRELQAQTNQGLESALASERDARAAELKSWNEAHQAEQTNLGGVIQGVHDLLHSKNADLQSRHDSLGLDIDSRHKEINELLEERLAAWEAKISNVVEPRVDANALGLGAIRDDFAKAMSEVNERFLKSQESLKQTNAETLAINEQSAAALKEELILESQRSQEAQKKLSDDVIAVDAKCNQWKSEFTKDYQAAHTQLDRAITTRYEASVNDSSLKLNKIVLEIKKDHDNALHDLQTRIDELRTTLVQERNNHAKWMDEERAAFRRAHEEHVHIVEVERDNRLRQIQEMRGDFMKTLKDRDGGDDKSRAQVGSQRPLTLGGSVSTTGSGTAGMTGSLSAQSTNAGSGTKLSSLLANLKAVTPQ